MRATPFLLLALLATPSVALADEGATDTAKPTVSLGKPRLAKGGALPKGTETALRAALPKLDDCYRAAIEAGHEGEPRLELRLELVGPGTVAAADLTSSIEASATLRACVRDAFAGVPAGAVGPEPIEVLLGVEMRRTTPDDLVLSDSSCSATCDGDLDESVVRAVRARAQAAAFCFKKAAAPGESATLKAGQLSVSMRIAPDGSVCGVGIGGDTFGRPSLVSCVMRELEKPLADGPASCAEAVFPLVYKGT